MLMSLDDDDTQPTHDHGVLAALRAELAAERPVVLSWSGGTAMGLVRVENEDRWIGLGGRVFAVADGMGGHRGGSAAAQATVDAVESHVQIANGLLAVIGAAHDAVRRVRAELATPRAGSTLVVVRVRGGACEVASVGDSRLYRLRKGVLEQMTSDDNVRNELAKADLSTDAADRANVRLDALTAYIGMDDPPAVTPSVFGLEPGDRLVLTSDGVHGQLDPRTLARLAAPARPPQETVTSLLEAADDAGGRDNATAVVVDVDVDRQSLPR